MIYAHFFVAKTFYAHFNCRKNNLRTHFCRKKTHFLSGKLLMPLFFVSKRIYAHFFSMKTIYGHCLSQKWFLHVLRIEICHPESSDFLGLCFCDRNFCFPARSSYSMSFCTNLGQKRGKGGFGVKMVGWVDGCGGVGDFGGSLFTPIVTVGSQLGCHTSPRHIIHCLATSKI